MSKKEKIILTGLEVGLIANMKKIKKEAEEAEKALAEIKKRLFRLKHLIIKRENHDVLFESLKKIEEMMI